MGEDDIRLCDAVTLLGLDPLHVDRLSRWFPHLACDGRVPRHVVLRAEAADLGTRYRLLLDWMWTTEKACSQKIQTHCATTPTAGSEAHP